MKRDVEWSTPVPAIPIPHRSEVMRAYKERGGRVAAVLPIHYLRALLSGGLDVADLIVVPHTCDSLQGLGSILLDSIQPRQPVLTLYLPRGRRESDIQFLADEFRRLHRRLKEITGHSPSQTKLLNCIRREEVADKLLGDLHRMRRYLPFEQIDFYRLLRSREYLPAESFSDLARTALAQAGDAISTDGIPIVLSGIVPEPIWWRYTCTSLNS